MDFSSKINEYIELIGCTGKELSETSGLSSATISRYRSGERIPDRNTNQLKKLSQGISLIAKQHGKMEITESDVLESLSALLKSDFVDTEKLRNNLNKIISAMSISISDISKSLNYDSSYISRIKNGQRKPAEPQKFAIEISAFIAHKCDSEREKSIVSELTGCSAMEICQESSYCNTIFHWLTNNSADIQNDMGEFLKKLDEFDLNEFIRVIHFDNLKVPSVPIQLPTSKNYYGLKEMMNSELDFLKSTVLSKSMDDVIMYSDMPIEEMAKDPEYPKKWMLGMAMMLKKGLHLHQIHNVNRPFNEMLLGLESWIPMYMTGQISPYYFKKNQNNVFNNFIKVSGAAALTGEAISGHHNRGRYYLTKNKDELKYYKTRAYDMLGKADSLMDIYSQSSEKEYYAFRRTLSPTPGIYRSILPTPPIYTISDALLVRILRDHNISEKETDKIIEFTQIQRSIAEDIMKKGTITDEIPVISEEEFERFPMALSLSDAFYERDIFYTYDEYLEHLQLTKEFGQTHEHYTFNESPSPAFRNIRITISERQWVLISKNKSPVIHFVIHHPKMREALEKFVPPIIDR